VHPFRWPRQIFAFARKEIAEVIRQPRLLIVMVLGPFAVMAAFGLGYSDEAPKLRTLFVMPPGSPFLDQVDNYAEQIDEYVDYRGVVSDRNDADRRLARGNVDVVVEFPAHPLETVLSGKRAVVQVVHTRLDPIDQTAISFVSSLAIDQINSEVLAQIVTRGQGVGGSATGLVGAAQNDVALIRAAIAANDANAASAAADDLQEQAGGVAVAASLSGAVTSELGEPTDATTYGEDVRASLTNIRNELPAVGSGDTTALAGELDRLDQLLAQGKAEYADALAVDPHVLVQPLDREVELAVPDVHRVTDWYAPAAVVLMLQQFGVAFGAMAFVRERQLGIDDVYRIAPVGASGSLLGKYVAYLVVGSIIGAALSVLVIVGLDVPVAGSTSHLAVVMVLTLFASIGLGFVVSLAARSDAQAVQYTMIILLGSLFFSGFFLSLDALGAVARGIAWLLPVTYGMRMLRDVMLRGTDPDLQQMAMLAGYGVVLFGIALIGAHRRMVAAVS